MSDPLSICRDLASGKDNSDLRPEGRAAIGELVAMVDELSKMPALWGVRNTNSPSGLLYTHHYERRCAADDDVAGVPFMHVIAITPAAYLQDKAAR